MTSPYRPRLAVEIVVTAEDAWRALPGAQAAVRKAAAAVARHPAVAGVLPARAVVALAANPEVQRLNAEFRGKDKPTNVLSFPASGPAMDERGGGPFLGDVVLACETVLAEAAEQDKPWEHHLQHLVVHGLLHLLGYDHETEKEARRMEALEVEILARLAIPDPYADAPVRQA